jgi:hypothetical protein
MTGSGAPLPPLLGLGPGESTPAAGQFFFDDLSAANVSATSPIPPALAIRRATSWTFSLWPPAGHPFTITLSPPGDGNVFSPAANGWWIYNYSGAIGNGVYTWQVTAFNKYGSTQSIKATFGSDAPVLRYTTDAEQEHATVYGQNFSNNICVVHVNGEGFIPDQNVTGDITKGVTVAIVCENEGQYWAVTVTPVGGGAAASLNVYCSGGGL